MVLASKIFLGALRIDLDLNIQKNGSLNPEIRISGSGSLRRALKKIILVKIIYGLRFLLLTNFDQALPSRGYGTDLS